MQTRMDMPTDTRKNNAPPNLEDKITFTWGDYNNELQGNASKARENSSYRQTFNTGGRTGERDGIKENSEGTEGVGGTTLSGRGKVNDFQFANPIAAETEYERSITLV